MRLKDIVRQHEGRLSPGDRRLIETFLSDPRLAALASTTELARAAGAHPSSLVRLSQKLGFTGFPELRALLRDELLPTGRPEDCGGDLVSNRPGDRLRRRLDDLPAHGVLDAVVAREMAVLGQLPVHVSSDEVEAVAALLAGARRILIFAEGGACALRELMVDRLRRLGRIAEPLPAEPRAASVSLTGLSAGEVVLAFAFVRIPNLLCPILETANEVGAGSVVIADLGGPLIRPQPTALLCAPRGPAGQSQSLIVPMAICHALILTLSAAQPEQALGAADRYQKLRVRMGQEAS